MLKEMFYDLMHRYTKDGLYVKTCWSEIEKAYSSSSRHYHSLTHLERMVLGLDEVAPSVDDVDGVLFTIFYHDIVYKSTKPDNEYQSAVLFKERISKTKYTSIEKCFAQIEATKEHKISEHPDTNIVLDLDLSILGASPSIYAQYASSIRKEYKIYPDFIYKRGREKVLKHLLEMPSIFKMDFFIEKFENQASINLQDELNRL